MSKEYLDDLLNHLENFAQISLKKRGEFVPFGAYIDSEKNIVNVATELIDVNESIDYLITEYRKKAKEQKILGTGICMDTKVKLPEKKEKQDALAFLIENIHGESLEAFIPYNKKLFGKYKFGQLYTNKVEAKVFK